ncbi:MAG: hypothetical protein GIW99_03865 [Candidatus Eremiobacteraeota bacterium]|nr:hypothetical protein [Candidatus Eremiobacteraeota bacterium]MBC5826809.1 hypothetical protein [Candidatus Eremiobacteraeota bacterium]
MRGPYLTTMIALMTAAFGLIAALAWNTAIQDFIKLFVPAGKGVGPEFVYAIVITVIAILVINSLGKLADKDQTIIK